MGSLVSALPHPLLSFRSSRSILGAPRAVIAFGAPRAVTASTPDEDAEQGLDRLAEGRAEEAGGVDASLAEDRLLLRERLEPLEPVIVPHPARADAAEREIVLRDVEHRLVDRHAAADRLA